MSFHPSTRRAAANLSIFAGVITKLAGSAWFTSAAQMVRMIMDHVAALTQAFQVALPVVARIMIEMRRRQDDAGPPEGHRLLDIRPSCWPAPAAAPGVAHRVEPTAIGQAADGLSVRPAAPLADTSGALETHASADLRPVDRVEPAQFTIDRQRSPRVRDRKYLQRFCRPA